MRRFSLACLLALSVVAGILGPASALAWGPAVHLRECVAVADRMVAQGHPLAPLVAGPQNRPWLMLGCIAPDFRQASAALSAIDTHSWQLGRYLVQAAGQPGAPKGATAFAIGHLTHHASDGVESWFATRMTAVAPLGALDLVAGVNDHAFGECELWVEVLGEFANGRTDLLVDLLEVAGVFGPGGLDWQPMVTWWVQTANALHGKPVAQPEAAVADVKALLAKAQKSLEVLTPEGIESLLEGLADAAPAENLQLLSALPLGDALASFGLSAGAGKLDPVRWRPMKNRPFFADVQMWRAEYGAMAGLAPQWTLDLVAGSKLDPSWPPSHDAWLMRAGIRASLAHAMPPLALSAEATVTFDEAVWLDPNGQPLTHWQAGPVTARVRAFALHPTSRQVALRVHATSPGLEPVGLGALVTQTVAELSIDPKTCVAGPCRVTLQATFDPGPWVGQTRTLVLALATAEKVADLPGKLPFVHGDWRRYQAHAGLEVFGPVYDPHAHALGGWPPGLQLPGAPPSGPGSLLVRVRQAPAGPAVPPLPTAGTGLQVRVLGPDGATLAQRQANAGGKAAVDGLAPGLVRVVVEGPGIAGKGPDALPIPAEGTAVVPAGEATTVVAPVWVVPAFEGVTLQGAASEVPSLTVVLQPLPWVGDQPTQVELVAGTQPGASDLGPPPGQPRLRPLPAAAATTAAKGRTYTLELEPAAWNTLQPQTLHVAVRLVASDGKDPAEELRGPWARTTVTVAAQPAGPEPGPDVGQGLDVLGDVEADVLPVAKTRPLPDEGCSARQVAAHGPAPWWLAGMALAAVLRRRARQRVVSGFDTPSGQAQAAYPAGEATVCPEYVKSRPCDSPAACWRSPSASAPVAVNRARSPSLPPTSSPTPPAPTAKSRRPT